MTIDREFLQFHIKGYYPDTLPLARLAEYLKELATLYGARESVHFDKLIKGSAVVQTWVTSNEREQVLSRLRSVKRPDAPEDVIKTYKKIDSMLRENQASATIKRKAGGEILAFPGKKVPVPDPIVMQDQAEVEGIVVRVGGIDKTIPVHIQGPDDIVYSCQVRDRAIAKDFAKFLYGPYIRVRGMGQWERSPEGQWKLASMMIEGWDELEDAPIDETIQRLRAIPKNGWKKVKDPDAEVRFMREGK